MRLVHTVEFKHFEWDEAKAQANHAKHGITFDEAAESLVLPHLEQESSRDGEMRTLAICPRSQQIITVIYTVRGEKCRIISARMARDYEQREYRFIFNRRDP